jgi:hypothetical protein
MRQDSLRSAEYIQAIVEVGRRQHRGETPKAKTFGGPTGARKIKSKNMSAGCQPELERREGWYLQLTL